MKRFVMVVLALSMFSMLSCGVGVEDEQVDATAQDQQALLEPTITSPRDSASGIATGKR